MLRVIPNSRQRVRDLLLAPKLARMWGLRASVVRRIVAAPTISRIELRPFIPLETLSTRCDKQGYQVPISRCRR
jgi:hypothetical protein